MTYTVKQIWREQHDKCPTLLLAWPGNPKIPHDVVQMHVPDGVTSFKAAADLAEATAAQALFLVEQLEQRVVLLLETHEGTLSISLPIERHGDVKVLGTEQVTRNTESIGVLWRKNRPTG